MTKESHKGIF